MTTPYKLLIHKNDSWTVKIKKRIARWLWNDVTKRQDLPAAAEGYPGADPPPESLLRSFDVRKHFQRELRRAQREEDDRA